MSKIINYFGVQSNTRLGESKAFKELKKSLEFTNDVKITSYFVIDERVTFISNEFIFEASLKSGELLITPRLVYTF